MSKSDKTKKYIVEKTAPVFNKKGVAGTSLSDLETATGLTKGSIYGNFASKDDVAVAAFDYNLSLLNKGIESSIQGSSTAFGRLLKMIEFYRTEAAAILKQGGCPILNTAVEADDTHPPLKEKVSASLKLWKKNIENIVQGGIASGEIRPGTDASAFAISYIALIEGGIMLAKVTGDINLLFICLTTIEHIINTELKV